MRMAAPFGRPARDAMGQFWESAHPRFRCTPPSRRSQFGHPLVQRRRRFHACYRLGRDIQLQRLNGSTCPIAALNLKLDAEDPPPQAGIHHRYIDLSLLGRHAAGYCLHRAAAADHEDSGACSATRRTPWLPDAGAARAPRINVEPEVMFRGRSVQRRVRVLQ